MTLRLGFHYHVPAIQKDGAIYMPGYLGRFVDSLAAHCTRLTCFLHTPDPDEMALMDYCIQSPAVDFVPIGPHESVPRRTLRALWCAVPRVRARRAELDAMLIRGPSPLLPFIAWAVRPVPTALLLVGDYLAGIDGLPQPWWRKELIRLWSYANFLGQMWVAGRSLTFVNSRRLYEELRPRLRNLVETRTTTLTDEDFFEREDTCGGRPIRLLYTGRIATEKGLLDMVEAVALLVEQGEDVVLDLVGWSQKNDPILDEIHTLAQARGVADRVFYHGYKPVGRELFAHYRRADIYVIASISNFEGFPRTIWEAMAHSLPVVATRVGSIPEFLQGVAELVEPRNSQALAEGVAALLHSPDRRRERILRGRALAAQHTIGDQTAKLVHELEGWLLRF